MTVREAQPDELDAVFALRAAVFADEQGFGAAAAPDADDARATHLVATDGGEVIGTCRLVPSHDGRLRLGYLAVAAWARGRGVGSAILTDALARALAGGFEVVVLHANPDAAWLYERAGFARVGTREVHGTELWTMERRVA